MESVFLRLLNMSLTGALVIAAAVLLRLPLRRAPKKWRYFLWIAPAFRLACPVSFRAFFSIFSLKPPAAASAVPAAAGAAELTYIRQAVVPPVPAAPKPVPAGAVPAAAVPVQAAASADPAQVLLTVAMVLWLAGLAAMLIVGAVRYLRMRGRLADAVKLEAGVFASDAIRVPFILGLLPPCIYVPAGLAGKELTYVLAHERAHLRRFDHWAKLLAYLLLSLHWFNPLVWLAFHLMSRDMEMSCDERVLSGMEGEAKDYSRTLLAFAAGRRFPAPAPLAFGESDVKSRIKNALRWRKPKLWVTVLAAVLCLAAVAACTANPSSGWLEDDDAVLNYAISNYQVEGQAITGGSYLYAGNREDGSVYKKFLVYLEDGTPRILTVNGSMIKRLGKMGTAMRATGCESEDIQNSPWMWFHSLRSEAVTEASWAESWPETREHALSKEQLRELVSRLNVLLPEEVVPDRGGPANRYVKLVTADGTFRLSYDGGVIAIAMDDAARARYPIPEGDPSPEWVIRSGSPPFEFLYSWLDALEFEASDEPEPHFVIPDIAAYTGDDTVSFGFAEGGVALLGSAGKTNQDVIDFITGKWEDISFRTEENFLSPGGQSVLSERALRPGMSLDEVRQALYGGGFPDSFLQEEKLTRPRIILHSEQEGSPYPVTGVFGGLDFALELDYSGAYGGQLTRVTLAFLPYGGEDRALEMYAMLRSALSGQLGAAPAEEFRGLTGGFAPGDHALAAWTDESACVTLLLAINEDGFRALTVELSGITATGVVAEPLSLMAGLRAEDYGASSSFGYTEPDTAAVAAAMNTAAEHPCDVSQIRDAGRLYWKLYMMFTGEAQPYGYVALTRHFELEAGLVEDLVRVSYYSGKTTKPVVVWVEDHTLYELIRDCYRQEPVVETGAWEKYGAALQARAQETVDSYEPYGASRFTGYEITRLEKTAHVWQSPEGEYLPVYAWDAAFVPMDVRYAGLSGGMGIDGDFRVTGVERETFFAVSENGGAPELTFLGDDVFLLKSEAGYPLWKEAYWRLLNDVILKGTEYETVFGPVQDLGLADLSGDGVPELICYLPGAGMSNAAAIVTFEEGEVRAFNTECTFGLPPAKNAVGSCFCANPEAARARTAAFRYDGAQGFWVLNSANGSNRDYWCRWFRFGSDRCGYLACEQLIDMDLQYDDQEREIGWKLNGEDVKQEEYRVFEAEYSNWLEHLNELEYPRIGVISLRDRDDGLPDRLAAWLGYKP